MTKTIHLLPALMLAGVLYAQTTAYEFRTVLQPGMTIAGHLFGPSDTIGTAVINDAGEAAFIARWPEYPIERSAIFTLHRMIASEGDTIDGAVITYIPLHSHLAINAFGTVAYAASNAQNDGPSVFIERHYLYSSPFGPKPDFSEFALNDRDEIVMAAASCAIANPLPHLSRPKPATGCGAFPMLPHNSRGQTVIALNTAQGPFLLIGTPRRH